MRGSGTPSWPPFAARSPIVRRPIAARWFRWGGRSPRRATDTRAAPSLDTGATLIDLDLATHVAQAVLVFGSLVVLSWFLAELRDLLPGARARGLVGEPPDASEGRDGVDGYGSRDRGGRPNGSPDPRADRDGR